MLALAEQRVVITGAAQGLGAAIARVFAGQGADLVLMDRDGAGLEAVNAEIGGGARVIKVDLGDADATAKAIAALSDLGSRPGSGRGSGPGSGQVDTLIHNAAILRPEPLMQTSLSGFQATLNVGIQAAFQLSQMVWPAMQARGGALIFVSSQSGIKGFADETAYCAAKHALEGLSKCLAIEGAGRGILSCTITPGKAMRTPMSEANYPPELKAQWIAPDQLAPAFAYIATRRDPALSGQRLNAWDIAREHPL